MNGDQNSIELQVCAACGAVQYPEREVCRSCLGDQLTLETLPGAGSIVASSVLHHSLDPEISALLPLTVALVKLDCGPVIITHVESGCAADAGTSVTVRQIRTKDDSRQFQASPMPGETV